MSANGASGTLDGLRIAIPGPLANKYPIIRMMTELGAKAWVANGHLPSRGDCDVLLLYRNARLYARRADELSRMANRPRTVLWQHEPLLPQELDPDYEARALSAVARAPGGRLARVVSSPLRRRVFRLVGREGLGPYSERAVGYLDPGRLRSLFESVAVIKRGVAEGWLDAVFVTTVQKQQFLASRGIVAGFAPLGSSDFDGRLLDRERDIDVLFLGKTGRNATRRAKLSGVCKVLRSGGLSVETATRGVFDDKRTALLNRTKIVMHLHNIPWDTPWKRWTIAAANGALVVSEPLSVAEPYKPGHHYVEATVDEMPATMTRLLEDYPRHTVEIVEACRKLTYAMSTNQSLLAITGRAPLPAVQDATQDTPARTPA